jgi:hypothetical protein
MLMLIDKSHKSRYLIGILLIIGSTIPFVFNRPFHANPLIGSEIPDKLYVVFRNDDISFASDLKMESHLINLFSPYKTGQIFAIIPRKDNYHYFYENKPLTDSLILWQQKGLITPSIHGYTHQYHLHGEFKGLPEKIQDSLISSALLVFRKVFTSSLVFCPPWNLLDKNTIDVCESKGIRIISGYRGEPVVDSVRYFNANLNLLQGELPSVQDILREGNTKLKKTILVILYHSSYDFKSTDELNELSDILQKLRFQYNCTFSNMDTLMGKYPDYIEFNNILGLNFKKVEKQISIIKYMGLSRLAFSLNKKLTNGYNYVFTGEPGLAYSLINTLIINIFILTFVLFFCLGTIIFMMALLVSLFLNNRYPAMNNWLIWVAPVYLLTDLILQYTYLVNRPKWQIILLLILYFMIGFMVPGMARLFNKKRPEKYLIPEN